MTRNFNEIYQEIYKNGIQELTALKNTYTMAMFLFLVSLVLSITLFFIQAYTYILVIAFICSIATLIYYISSKSKYSKAFKSLVMQRLVYMYNPDLKFRANEGISYRDYRESFFDNNYDDYYSEDLIYGDLDEKTKIKMAQVKTTREEVTTDSDGHPHHTTVTVFLGLFGVVEVGDRILAKMDITSNSFFNKHNTDRIEVDSGEFEKKYDMFSTDKVRTMEIFTSDLIEEFNKFYEETKNIIQIRVSYNKLYFRINCGDAFEVPQFKNALDYQVLYKNFRLIDFPISTILKILENADETRR